jgi:hypothetical protein
MCRRDEPCFALFIRLSPSLALCLRGRQVGAFFSLSEFCYRLGGGQEGTEEKALPVRPFPFVVASFPSTCAGRVVPFPVISCAYR